MAYIEKHARYYINVLDSVPCDVWHEATATPKEKIMNSTAKHVSVLNVNGNPHDNRLTNVGDNLDGTWSRRAVHVRDDDYGTEYVVMDGLEYDLEDVNYVED